MSNRSDESLAAILAHAAASVPFYQTALPAGPERSAPLEELRRLPLLTRQQVQRHAVRLWSHAGDARDWTKVSSTGTTGEPVVVAVDPTARRAELDGLARHVDVCTGGTAWRDRSLVHLALHATATSRSAAAPWSAVGRLVKWNLSRLWQLPDDEFAAQLARVNGHVVTAMPSVVATLLDRITAGDTVRPALVVLSGERVGASIGKRIAAVFHAPATAVYTLAEAGLAAFGCASSGGYHVNEEDVVLEILDPEGADVPAGHPGAIVVSSLRNFAMPLLRYLTGDQGAWIDQECGCPYPGRLFGINESRTLRVVAAGPGGRQVTGVDLAKLFTNLDVSAVRLTYEAPIVTVEYRAEHEMPAHVAAMTTAAVRGLLGVSSIVHTQRVADDRLPVPEHAARTWATGSQPVPRFPAPDELARWTRDRLQGRPVVAATLTGSLLDPLAVSRFSDLDLTVVIDEFRDRAGWLALVTSMRDDMPGLRVNVTTPGELSDAPLVTCRLLTERFPVVGSLDACGLAWPSRRRLRDEGSFWLQEAYATIWTRSTARQPHPDVLREAWLGVKYALNAVRFVLLCTGRRVTAPREVLRAAVSMAAPGAGTIQEAFHVSRELVPPPAPGSSFVAQLYVEALSLIAWARGEIA